MYCIITLTYIVYLIYTTGSTVFTRLFVPWISIMISWSPLIRFPNVDKDEPLDYCEWKNTLRVKNKSECDYKNAVWINHLHPNPYYSNTLTHHPSPNLPQTLQVTLTLHSSLITCKQLRGYDWWLGTTKTFYHWLLSIRITHSIFTMIFHLFPNFNIDDSFMPPIHWWCLGTYYVIVRK